MNERVHKIFDLINSSEKKVTVLSYDEGIGKSIKEKYQPDPESVLGILLGNTGGIVIEDWIRLYGSGELDKAVYYLLYHRTYKPSRFPLIFRSRRLNFSPNYAIRAVLPYGRTDSRRQRTGAVCCEAALRQARVGGQGRAE